MDNSKAQQKIIDLGKSIVNDLTLDPGVDTLSKWMAHYIAEKIELAESLTGKEKEIAQKECCGIINKLWEHRWSIPNNKPFLSDFKELMVTLEKLNPERKSPFYYSPKVEFIPSKEETKKPNHETQCFLEAARALDKLTRSIVYELLHQGIEGLELSKERSKTIKKAINLIDQPDTLIIKIISGYEDNSDELKSDDEKLKEMKIKKIENMIEDLKEIKSLSESMTTMYQKMLSELNK